MKATFYTLGCKVNQNETGALEQLFSNAGYDVVPDGELADVYVVNSCTVTAGGDSKSRQWLRRAKRQNPDGVTVLTGCFPQAFPEEALIPEANVITGTSARSSILENVKRYIETGEQVVDIIPHSKEDEFEELPVNSASERTRAFIKIEDGCNRRCAYCIIPFARGTVRSRREASILQEVETLAENGYSEVVFTGINLPSYGKDTDTCLADIVEKTAAIEGVERIRLSSLDPDLITQDQCSRFAKVDKLCPQFHLSLQSGCDETLRRMRRPYTAQGYRDAAAMLRAAKPGATFTTDVIVGFPGETEEEFAQCLAFVEEMEFLKVHVFPYSRRPGTPAAEFEDQVPQRVKVERASTMQKTADKVREKIIASFEGTEQQVLLEKPLEDSVFTGYTSHYIPVLVQAPAKKQGDIVTVRLGAFDGQRCACEML